MVERDRADADAGQDAAPGQDLLKNREGESPSTYGLRTDPRAAAAGPTLEQLSGGSGIDPKTGIVGGPNSPSGVTLTEGGAFGTPLAEQAGGGVSTSGRVRITSVLAVLQSAERVQDAFRELRDAGYTDEEVVVVASPSAAEELVRAADWGLSEASLRDIEAGVAQGQLLVRVRVTDAERIEEAERLLRAHGADHVMVAVAPE